MLLNIVRDTLERHHMIQPGCAVVVGVSGGPDSVALLHVLHALSQDMDFRIMAAHLDHRLRSESAGDAAFVEDMAEGLDIGFVLERVNVAESASALGVSMEEAGRRERYAFFERVRTAWGAAYIATAHHRDDALETFFLRILRGSSLQGLTGIPARRHHIIRPLIHAGRSQILDFLQEHHLPFRIDRTNLDDDTDRNFIRNRLFPVIDQRFPTFRKPLMRTLDMIQEEDAFVAQEAMKLYDSSVLAVGDEFHVDLNLLLGSKRVLQARTVLIALYQVSGPHVRWARSHVHAILRLARAEKPSGILHLPGNVVVSRTYECLVLSPVREGLGLPEFPIAIDGPCQVSIPEAGLTLSFRIIGGAPDLDTRVAGADTVYFDAALLPFPLELRPFRPGDRFRPWGMSGTCKVKKVLIDAKMPRPMRRAWPLLVKKDEIVWIPRVRRSSAAALGPHTTSVLEAKCTIL